MAATFTCRDRTYPVDSKGFLVESDAWDEAFSEGMADRVGIEGGLGEDHRRVIRWIRATFLRTGVVPLVYETCRRFEMRLADLKRLFPAGYLRGACKLAGCTYREGCAGHARSERARREAREGTERTYRVDVRGFLVDPADWDEPFAIHKAWELKMGDGLTAEHWAFLSVLRDAHGRTGRVPTVYDACAAARITIWDLARLFPDGYHRGAVKLAGLRVR
jgi:tRNA 2-thiouridine synthesizing protein E